MDKCLYNGEIIYSFEVAKSYEKEKEIRECSDLMCCNPECMSPVRYKHGTKKSPYFAHISTNKICDYDKYTHKNSEIFKKVHQLTFNHFRTLYDNSVDIDIKIIKEPSHYTALTITNATNNYAIDIIDKRISSSVMSRRSALYKSLNYTGLQLIIDENVIGELNERSDFYYSIKYELNNSNNNIAIIIDKKNMTFTYCRLDKSSYIYKGFDTLSMGKRNVFSKPFDLSELIVDSKGFSVPRLDKEYADWIDSRKSKYTEYIEKDRAINRKTSGLYQHINRENKSPAPSGKFEGIGDNGKKEYLDLEQIKINKNVQNYFMRLSENKIIDLVEQAFNGQISSVRQIMSKMYYADNDEKSYFIKIYEKYINSEQNSVIRYKVKILEHVMKEAEILK